MLAPHPLWPENENDVYKIKYGVRSKAGKNNIQSRVVLPLFDQMKTSRAVIVLVCGDMRMLFTVEIVDSVVNEKLLKITLFILGNFVKCIFKHFINRKKGLF